MFHVWTHFADIHHIQYWTVYGTLVCYVQRRGLLPHDLDIGVLILVQNTENLIPFSDAYFSSSQGINFVAPNARFIHRELHLHIDIWPIYDYHPNQLRSTTKIIKTLTEYSRSYEWIPSPIEWTFPSKKCVFSGIK
ncbi:unnamed protein product, partial [Rotaria magnacalcarata]